MLQESHIFKRSENKTKYKLVFVIQLIFKHKKVFISYNTTRLLQCGKNNNFRRRCERERQVIIMAFKNCLDTCQQQYAIHSKQFSSNKE